jgi:hypothetical protein
MSGIEYFVVPEGANWKIRVQDQDFTRHDTLREAIEAVWKPLVQAASAVSLLTCSCPEHRGGWASVCL